MADKNARALSEGERESLRTANANLGNTTDWLDTNYDQLVREFPDRWILYGPTGVLKAADTLEEILLNVDHESIRQGKLQTEFIPAKPLNMIL